MGKQESPHLRRNVEALRYPKCDNNYPYLRTSIQYDRRQMMCSLLGSSSDEMYPSKLFRFHLQVFQIVSLKCLKFCTQWHPTSKLSMKKWRPHVSATEPLNFFFLIRSDLKFHRDSIQSCKTRHPRIDSNTTRPARSETAVVATTAGPECHSNREI